MNPAPCEGSVPWVPVTVPMAHNPCRGYPSENPRFSRTSVRDRLQSLGMTVATGFSATLLGRGDRRE